MNCQYLSPDSHMKTSREIQEQLPDQSTEPYPPRWRAAIDTLETLS